MLQRVYEQALKARSLSEVLVATDDLRIQNHVFDFGGKVVMTSPKHLSGTDRIAEVIKKMRGSKPFGVVNIQGDEPFIDPLQIDGLVKLLLGKNTFIATLALSIHATDEINTSSVVKLVLNKENEALLFSRSRIPFNQSFLPDHEAGYLRHIGIYAYRTKTLLELSRLKPGKLEKLESLEQLRWLENGYSIRVGITTHSSFSIDTPEDLKRIGEDLL